MRQMLMCMALLVELLVPSTTVAADGAQISVEVPPDGVAAGTTVEIQRRISGMKVVPSQIPLNEASKHPEANRPGEGHVHYILDLQPLATQYKEGPIRLTDVSVGEHSLMVELVNNDHSAFSPPVMQQIRFRTVPGALPSSGAGGTTALPVRGETLLILMVFMLNSRPLLEYGRRWKR